MSTDKEAQKARIRQIMDDNDYRYHVYPHYGCVPDWFIAYKELAKAIVEYFTIEETSIDNNGQEEQEAEQQT